jgi:hypothetical protein
VKGRGSQREDKMLLRCKPECCLREITCLGLFLFMPYVMPQVPNAKVV